MRGQNLAHRYFILIIHCKFFTFFIQAINDCKRPNICPKNFKCVNGTKSYECVCRDGFREIGTNKCEGNSLTLLLLWWWLLLIIILLLVQVLVSLSLFLFPKSRYIEFDRGCLMNEIQFICFIRTVTNPEIWLDLSAVQIFLTLPKGTLSNAFASRKHYKPVCNPIILSHKVSQKVRIVRCLFTIRYVNVTFIHLIPEFSKTICSL